MRILYFPKDCPTLTSAYAKIAYYLAVKRLSKVNNPASPHDVTLFCTVPQQLTVLPVDGVELYPGMSDMNGEDLFLEWYKQLNCDVYLTQYDPWPLNKVPQAAMRGEIVWIAWCVSPESQIDMFSEEVGIGFENGNFVKNKILGSLQRKPHYPMYQIETRDGHELIISGNHRVGTPKGWVRAEKLKKDDLVYFNGIKPNGQMVRGRGQTFDEQLPSLHNFQVKKNFSQSIQQLHHHSRPKIRLMQENSRIEIRGLLAKRFPIGGNSVVISSRIHGRRRNNNSYSQQENTQEERVLLHSSPFNFNRQHQRAGNTDDSELARQEEIWKRSPQEPTHGTHFIRGKYSGLQCLPDSEEDAKVLDSESGSLQNTYNLYRKSNGATSSCLVQQRRYSVSGTSAVTADASQTTEVSKIRRIIYRGKFVNDLRTSTGNYYANGLLVHNCYMDFIDFPEYIIQKIRPALRAIPTSKWLESELIKKGLSNVTSPVSPGVDPEEYHVMLGEKDSAGKEVTKERLRVGVGFEPDSFVIGMVQMNQLWRKPFAEQFEGIKIFAQNNKDLKVRLYVHSQPRVRDSWDLPALAKYYGIDKITRFADPIEMVKGVKGYSEDRMCKIYNGFDVLLEGTGGESPGYPLIEAQSCGVPCIGTDCTAIPEFIRAGYTVKVAKYIQSPNLIKKALPDPYDIADKLEKVARSGYQKWVTPARDFAKQFTWDRTYNEMSAILEKAEVDIESMCVKVPPPTSGWESLMAPEML